MVSSRPPKDGVASVAYDASHAERVRFCYSYYEHFSNLIGKSDYTDGMYFGDRTVPYEIAQDNQIQYLLNEAGVRAGMRVLDIGCGRGRLLRAAEARGAKAVGITISSEQVRFCQNQGLDVRLMDYREISAAWPKYFDVVIANGSIEHFVSVRQGLARQASAIYAAMFDLIHRAFDPASSSGRLVTTVIHHRSRHGSRLRIGLQEKLMFSLLSSVYGGWYPLDGQLERCAEGRFQPIRVEDGTQDYLWTSQDAFAGWVAKLVPRSRASVQHVVEMLRTLARAGIKAPLFLLNPYLWTWQFQGQPPPVVLRRHTWKYVP